MITKEDKELILTLFTQVDVKKMVLEHQDQRLVKWFRFGSYNGLQVASEIIKNLPESKNTARVKKIKVS